jgi:short-subunit dehydrogenase
MPSRSQIRFRKRYGPWAVVTGASSGIGREIAGRLAQAGLNLVLVARSSSVLEQIAAELTNSWGIECRAITLDLSLEAAAETLANATDDLGIGLMVASAGFGTSGPFIDSPLERELEMLQVNCCSLLVLTWHFGKRFSERQRGGIILLRRELSVETGTIVENQLVAAGL